MQLIWIAYWKVPLHQVFVYSMLQQKYVGQFFIIRKSENENYDWLQLKKKKTPDVMLQKNLPFYCHPLRVFYTMEDCAWG